MADPGPAPIRRVLEATSPDDSPAEALVLCDWALERGDARLAASALDRAYALAPQDPLVARHRQAILDSLAVVEHGIRFRYVPAGAFLMGGASGEADERPVHPVFTRAFWLSEAPVTWDAYSRLMGWAPGAPGSPRADSFTFMMRQANKIRRYYCESRAEQLTYGVKPMIAVGWHDAVDLGQRLTTQTIRYRLPTEAEWEKAARGGLIGARYAWGDEPPDPTRCDFGHFGDFVIKPPTSFPPNGYGLFGMCGGVWEWTADEYDALAYRRGGQALVHDQLPLDVYPAIAPSPPPNARQRVARGGSWADCAEAVTVSFRMSHGADSWQWEPRGRAEQLNPNIGFRLCRVEQTT